MKTHKTSVLFSFLCMLFSLSLIAIESNDKINESYAIPGIDAYSEVYIKNLHGSVTVESYNGKTVVIEATKTITAKNENNLEKGKSQINLKAYEYDKGVFIYLDHPCADFNAEELELCYNCNEHRNFWNKDYEFNIDILVKIPKDVDFVEASTVNKGELKIQNLSCNLNVSNVNGSLEVENHSGNIEATTVNGDVTVSFLRNPTSYANFSTINGTIEVKCLKQLSAKVNYKTMHGDFFTNYDNIEFLANKLIKSENKHHQSTKYKLGSIKSFKIGKGEADFSFKTLNGDMYLKN